MNKTVRGVMLPPPLGSKVIARDLPVVILPEKLDITEEELALIEDQRILGTVKLGEPKQINDVSDIHRLYGLTKEDIETAWPNSKTFFVYDVTNSEALSSPIYFDVQPNSGLIVESVQIPDVVSERGSSDAEVVVLGTKGMIRDPSRKHASLLIVENGFRLRIDKGDYDQVQYDALVVTHAHPDHISGVGREESFYSTEPVRRLVGDRVNLLPWREPVTIGPFSVTAYPVVHSTKAQAAALRIEGPFGAIAYAPDVLAWESRRDRTECLDRANIYFGDGSHPSGVIRRSDGRLVGHAPWATQLSWAHEAGVQEVVLTHLGEKTVQLLKGSEIDDITNDLEAKYGLRIRLAKEGDTYTLVKKLDLERFRAEGLDYDIENAGLRWRELLADLRYLANSGYVRLKSGKPWGDWTLEDIAKYFGRIVDALRGVHFPLIPPADDDPRSKTPYWELYRLAERKGFIKTKPPTQDELEEWDKKRAVLIKSNLSELHQALPDYVLIVPEWASLSGSFVYGQHAPHDVDVVLKAGAPSGSLLKIQRALQTKVSTPVQFIVDESGPTWDYVPLYDLVAIKVPFSVERVREGKIARDMLYKGMATKPEAINPGVPVQHYEVPGEFYVPHEIKLAWDEWGRKVVERGDKIYVNPKYDGIRFIFSWDGKKAYLFTEKGENRASAFPGIEKIAKKIGVPFVVDTEFVEFDDAFEKQLSRTVMTWMATGHTPKTNAKIKIFVHDLAYINGKNVAALPYAERWNLANSLISKPIKLGRFRVELAETNVVDSYELFERAVNEFRAQKPGRSTEGAMAKASSFIYDPAEARRKVIKLKNRIEVDALILGYREMPKAREPGKKLSENEALELLGKRTGVYSFRLGLVDEETGLIVPIEAKKKLSETDLKVSWDEDRQQWKGLDDPKLWVMFFDLPHRGLGEYAYGNSYSVSCDCIPEPGMILTLSPMEITTWEDEAGVHASFQHPIAVGIKDKDHTPGSVQSALIAHGKPLPKRGFAVLIDIPNGDE